VLEVLGEFGTTGARLRFWDRLAMSSGINLRTFAAGDGCTLSPSVADDQVVMADETHTRLPFAKPGEPHRGRRRALGQ
jgi:hypothetical protein